MKIGLLLFNPANFLILIYSINPILPTWATRLKWPNKSSLPLKSTNNPKIVSKQSLNLETSICSLSAGNRRLNERKAFSMCSSFLWLAARSSSLFFSPPAFLASWRSSSPFLNILLNWTGWTFSGCKALEEGTPFYFHFGFFVRFLN